MKKRKVLYLFPLLGLLLSGCTFQEGLNATKGWISSHLVDPIKNLINGGGKEDKKEEDKPVEERVAEEITAVHAPESIYQNKTLALADVDLTVLYSDGTTEEAHPDKISLDTSVVKNNVQGKAHFGDLSKVFTINVLETPAPTHAGTAEDPYTGADAVLVAEALEPGSVTEDFFFIKDKVESFEEAFNPSYGNVSIKLEGGFIGWRLKFGSDGAKFNEGDVEVGDTVTMNVKIQLYVGSQEGAVPKAESKDGYITAVEKEGPAAELLSIAISGNPKTEYISGDPYTSSGLSVTATYSNEETQDVTLATSWSYSKATAEVGDESVTITAAYGGMTDELVVGVTVIDGSAPQHAGTAEDPYTGYDAVIVASKLPNKTPTAESYYIKGVVQTLEEAFNPTYGNFTFTIEGGFEGYRLLNGPDKAKFTSADQLEVGDTVTMYAQIQKFNSTMETSGGYIVSIEKQEIVGQLDHITISGTAKSEYLEGDSYTAEGLVVTAYYDNNQSKDVTSQVDWGFSKEKAELNDEPITITASFEGKTDSLEVPVTVTPKPVTVHAGTLEDPFDGADANAMAATLVESTGSSDKHPTTESYYIKGVVQEMVEAFNPSYGNFTFKIEDGFEGFRLKNGPEQAKFTSADQLKVGDTVTMYAQILNFKGTYETEGGYIHSIESVFVAPETVEITSGSELGVGSTMNLAATVGPTGAAQDVEWVIVSGGEYATLSDGVLTGVAAGDVVVKATAVGYENVYAEKTITVSSSVVPTEQVVYTLDGTVTATGNAYATATVLTQGGVEWSVTGNTEMSPWRIGGKGLTNVDRPVSSNGTVSTENISKVAVDIGATGSGLTVNSVTLNVGTTAGGSDISTQTVTANITNNVVEFERPSNANWASAYFTVVFNVTRTSTSGNGYVALNAITFYAVI